VQVVCHVKAVDWYRLTDHYFMDGSKITLPSASGEPVSPPCSETEEPASPGGG
jgi:hypothetical protein